MQILPLNINQIDEAIAMVRPLWRVEGASDAFNDAYVGYIVRHNCYDNEFALQATEENGHLLGIITAARKGEHNKAKTWLEERIGALTEAEQADLRTLQHYLEEGDRRTLSLMGDEDVKLSFFASARSGCGRMLLEEDMRRFRKHHFQNMYLWTDITCSHNYYPRHGFQLVDTYKAEEFSTDEADYLTYIYRKNI
jgi:predicted N-acetyltransferase YhbS